MIETPDFPAVDVVALGAIRSRAKRTGMMFVDMAGLTCDPLGRKSLVSMAFLARYRRVLACQREARQFMIKEHLALPAIDIVTTAAIGPKPRFMGVIVGMASHAGTGRQLHMRRFFVTCLAQHRLVCALQREAGHRVMIELGNLPVFAVVAFGALGAVAAFMRIVLFVTANAGHRRILDRVIRAVATSASGGHMRADKLESRILIMIEIDRFPR